MKKLITLCLSLVLCAGLVACSNGSEEEKITIGLVQLMDHTSLNTIRDSILMELEEQGYVDGENVTIDLQNAGGDTSTLSTICEQFKSEDADVIIAITTPAAQAAAPFADEIPVIFSAVSDPVAANLLSDLNSPDKNITGTSDEVQISSIMDLALEMYPETQTIGYIYNSGEVNSVSNLEKLQAYADENGYTVQAASVTNASEIQVNLQSLTENCDIIFSPTDNTVASAMAQVSQMCNDAGVPFFAGADSMVSDGALATYGINYENLGRETAKMAIDVINGTKIADIPVKVFNDELDVYYNVKTAEALNFSGLEALQSKYNVITVE